MAPRRDARVMNLNLEALEESFDAVAPRGDELMEEFYGRLFEAAPAVKPLFAGTDMRRQKAMLLSALVLVRKSLRDLDSLVPKLRQLGARHVAYARSPSTTRLSRRCSSPRWRRSPARPGSPSTRVRGAMRSASSRP
jgi:Globin